MAAKKTKAEGKTALPSFVELGTSGLDISAGRIVEEWLPALKNLRSRMAIFREMRDNDPTVGAVLFAIEMLMRQVEWRVEPATEEPADLPAAEFVHECMNDMAETWDDTIASVLSMLPYGFSLHEEVYKYRRGPAEGSSGSQYDDGKLGWRKLAGRAHETIDRWDFDENDDLELVVQRAPPDWMIREMPASRLILFRTTSVKGNPEGRSVLRNAYRPWFLKKEIERIEAIGIERDLAGLPVAEVPPAILDPNAGASEQTQLVAIKKLLRNIRRDSKEGIVFPLAYNEEGHVTYKLSLMSTGGRRQFDTSAIVSRYDKRIAQTVLADFILLGQDKVGSFALAESKTELFSVAIGAWLESVAQVFNRVAIPRLLNFNAFDTSRGFPTLGHGDIESVDIEKLGVFITALSGAGAPLFPDDELERHLRMRAGLPEQPEDREDPEPPPEPPPPMVPIMLPGQDPPVDPKAGEEE